MDSDNIDKALGVIEQLPFKTPAQELVNSGQVKPVVEKGMDDVEKDYEYQRQNFYNLVERGSDAIEGILELAKESDHPRAYEVAGNLIKQVADVTEKPYTFAHVERGSKQCTKKCYQCIVCWLYERTTKYAKG